MDYILNVGNIKENRRSSLLQDAVIKSLQNLKIQYVELTQGSLIIYTDVYTTSGLWSNLSSSVEAHFGMPINTDTGDYLFLVIYTHETALGHYPQADEKWTQY